MIVIRHGVGIDNKIYWKLNCLLTNNDTIYKYALAFHSLLYYSCLLAVSSQTRCWTSGSDNGGLSGSSQAHSISLCCGLIIKLCPQQFLNYVRIRNWSWCTRVAVGDWCLSLPSNGPLCNIVLTPRF
jgi:hypothetical protein